MKKWLLLLTFGFTSCSTGYYTLHNIAKQQCDKNPNSEDRQKCRAEHEGYYQQPASEKYEIPAVSP